MTKEELEKKMTNKQYVFCHEYIKDWNGTKAAIKAGYTEKNARVVAAQNLAKVNIKEYIELIKNDIATEAGLSKLNLINELKILAFSNLPAILQKLRRNNWDFSTLTEDEQKVISDYSDTDSGIKIKAYDKRAAIQDILKAMGWNEAEILTVETKATVIKWGNNEITV